MPRHDDLDDDRPRRRRRDDDEDDGAVIRPRRTGGGGRLWLILGIVGGVLLLCCGGGGILAWLLSDRLGFESRDQKVSNNNLREIGLAAHMYHDATNGFPNNSYAPDGRPLLSWRVHLLPYLGENTLYRQFNLDEPWDGPTNRPLLGQMPRVYITPDTRASAGEGKTFYRGFSHAGAVFERPAVPGNRLHFGRISDGTSNTILVVEAGEAVEWTKPDDLDFGPGRPRPALGAGRGRDDVLVLVCDGSTRYVRKALPDSTWRALISYNGGEVVGP